MNQFTFYVIVFTIFSYAVLLLKNKLDSIEKNNNRNSRRKKCPQNSLDKTRIKSVYQKISIEQLLNDQSELLWPTHFDDCKIANILDDSFDVTRSLIGNPAIYRNKNLTNI